MKQCYVFHVCEGMLLMHLHWHYNVSKGWDLNRAKCADSLLKAPFIAPGNIHMKYLSGLSGCAHIHNLYTQTTHTHQPPSGLTFSTSTLKIEMLSSPPGQKTSLTQETELLESLLQEVEHQVGSLQQLKASIHLATYCCCVSSVKLWQFRPGLIQYNNMCCGGWFNTTVHFKAIVWVCCSVWLQ